jgi:integrase/recombinase XerD
MANVFRRGKVWYARFRNIEGKWQKEAGFTDKTATLQLAIKREHEADLVRKGLAEAPQPKNERLIGDDLTAFGSALANKEVSEGQIELVVGRCERLCKGCEFATSSDIDPVKVEEWLAGQRKAGKKKKSISVQTSNHYLRAIKQLTRWLHRHKKLRDDPLVHLEMLNVAVDRRHDRRALSDTEVAQLLKATMGGGNVLGMSAVDRHMLYVMALSTGLRASELASLKRESLSLEVNPPTVKVKAGYSKRRRLDVLPLPSDILEEARKWLTAKQGHLWPGRWAANRTAGKMIQVDLKAAGIAYQDEDGLFADFHALRHTYITNLARRGVPLVTAQKLARHSTPVLTAARYTHIELADQHREVEKLPSLNLGRDLGQTGDVSRHKSSPTGTGAPSGTSEALNQKDAKSHGNPENSRGFSGGEGGIRTLEPLRVAGFQDRCDRPLRHLSGSVLRLRIVAGVFR